MIDLSLSTTETILWIYMWMNTVGIFANVVLLCISEDRRIDRATAAVICIIFAVLSGSMADSVQDVIESEKYAAYTIESEK